MEPERSARPASQLVRYVKKRGMNPRYNPIIFFPHRYPLQHKTKHRKFRLYTMVQFLRVTVFFVLQLVACGIPVFGQDASPYSYTSASRDGTGKWYMGREISQIMGFHGMAWLERPERSEEENTDLAIKNLPLTANSVVADIGAGSGFYTFRIAKKVTEGTVYAVEIQQEAIDFLQKKADNLGMKQVVPVVGSDKSPNLPEGALDLILMVDVYHELAFPQEMLQNMRKALKPTGKLVLIEYRGEDPAVAIKPLHKMTVRQVKKELGANGFTLEKNGQFLNIQHFLVFEKER
ncbi:Methyltransferase domain-containing protein [Cyclobacterium xiamenense]|uniref:Methyltransferase domain-containing protein n=2 Tax=Cyclobacterium xiamenense TaxID=1297121 RepID=A0A1H6UGE8_9BACT|nr:Methyltransferase domain-containing protein [Cyclobacterium xiamenense]